MKTKLLTSMKQVLAFVFCVLIAHTPVRANILATVQWELRTTGNDSNGGGFDAKVTSPGTDYSQQDAAQLSFTDLTVKVGNSTQVWSLANPIASFTAITSRGTSSNISATTSVTVTFPAGSASGDLAILFVGSQAGVSVPSGWSQVQSAAPANWAGSTMTKTLTSGDITTGSVTINSSGSGAMVGAMQVFVGGTAQVRENQATGNNAATASVTLSTTSGVMSSDYGVWFASCRCGTLPTINQGSLAQSQNNTSNGTGVLYDGAINAPGSITATSTYSGYNTAGYYSSNVVIQPVYNTNPYPGNVIQINSGSGCTTGWFEITSVSGTLAQLDRSAGTDGSTCTAHLGGGFLTPQGAENAANNSCFCNNSGETVWVKFGTYTITSTVSGGARQDNYWVGYNTTHGDGGGASLNWPTITTATSTTDLFNINSFNFGLTNFHFTNTAITANKAKAINQSNGSNITVANATFSGFKNAVYLGCCGSYNNLRGVTILSDAQNALTVEHGQTASCAGCFIYGSTGDGVIVSPGSGANNFICTNCVIAANTGKGIEDINQGGEDRIECSNCTIYGNGGGGIIETSLNATNSILTYFLIKSSIIYGNTGWGVNNLNATNTPGLASQYLMETNAWGSNSLGNYSSTVFPGGPGDVTLTANPFNNAAGGDFSLNNTTGGGKALKALGFPGTYFGSSTTGLIDIGGVQTGGGSGGTTISPIQ